MLTDIHRAAPRARLALGNAASSQALRPLGVSLLKTSHHQQTRAYRFGMWSSYLDPEFSKELQRRRRNMRHKLVASWSRKLSWEQHPFAKDARDVLKHMMESQPLSEEPSRSRSVNSDSPHTRDTNSKGADGKGSSTGNLANPFTWFENPLKSQFEEVFHEWNKQTKKGAKQAESDFTPTKKQAKAQAKAEAAEDAKMERNSEDEDYLIDPITNRRISRDTAKSTKQKNDGPPSTFKSYRSQFSQFAPPASHLNPGPIHSDGPPPAEELRKYDQITIDPNPTGVSGSDPSIRSEEYSLNHLPPDEPNEVYDDLHKYKPYMYNEPNGTLEEAAPQYDDLHKYEPYMYNENAKPQEPHQQYDDLDNYGPYMYKEDAKPEEFPPRYKDLDDYQPFMYREEQADWSSSKRESSPQYDDLDKDNPTRFDDPLSPTDGQPFSQYGDLAQYKVFRYQEPDKQAALEDSAAEKPAEYEPKDAKPTISERLQKLDLSDAVASLGKPRDTVQSSLVKSYGSLLREMEEQRKASDEVDREARASVQESRARAEDTTEPAMTGNFVKDFPEEFARSWSLPMTSSSVTETPDSSKLEPALDRQAREQAEVDPYSKEPQGLETSYAEECGGRPTWPTFVKTYGADPNPGEESQETQSTIPNPTTDIPGPESESTYHRDPEIDGLPREETPETTTATAATASEPNSTLYKILAYDPTTQNITTAETTSRVYDEAKPLTPAEVLLQLSHPSKFLPHFATLQAEGFEIISGGTDLLVFRKIRLPPPPTKSADETSPPVNPIDLMGRPMPINPAASFASPTGFVNYELPVEKESVQDAGASATDPPFRSGIDVRREEPVFSGPKSEVSRGYGGVRAKAGEEGGKKKRLGIGKRMLLTGAWVGAISYATGVMTEYFITGGVDGKGPTGL